MEIDGKMKTNCLGFVNDLAFLANNTDPAKTQILEYSIKLTKLPNAIKKSTLSVNCNKVKTIPQFKYLRKIRKI